MKISTSILLSFYLAQAYAQSYEFDSLVKDGSDEVTISFQGKMDGRYVYVWVPEIQKASSVKKSEEIQEAIKNPFPVFKTRVENDYKKFVKLSEDFLSCVKGRKWPGKTECLKHINYCFNIPEKNFMGRRACDGWRSDKLKEMCPLSSNKFQIDYCLKNEEKAFDLFTGCFYKDNFLGFKYISSTEDEIWSKDLFMLISTSNIPPYNINFSCVFTYYKETFNLIEIRNGMSGDMEFEFVSPPSKSE